jgi:hypothetical protein
MSTAGKKRGQVELVFRTHGGKRPGAGRKPKGKRPGTPTRRAPSTIRGIRCT